VRAHLSPPLLALTGLFLALCLAYNLAVPLFEAPDERDHVDYADWLASGNGLPHMVNDREEVGEIWQPPLYYALIAAALAPFDRSDLETIAPLSADWQAGLSRAAHYHTAAESFPFRGAALAVHAARFVSSLLGLVTILATYAIARMVVRGHAIIAAALVALNPQFIFLSAVVNNDNLVIALCSVGLWALVKLATAARPGDKSESRREIALWGGLGLVWGLAALAKLTGVTLGLVIGLGLLYMAFRQRSWRPLLLGGLLVGGAALAVAGWWFWRNWRLYGDPIAWNEMLAVTAGLLRPELLTWPETLRYATFLRKTYWAMFGYGVAAPESFYWMIYIIVGLALAGLVKYAIAAVRPKRPMIPPALWLPAIWSLTVFVLLLRWMRQIDTTNQGRLLFPAIAGLSVLAAVGLAALDGRRKRLGMTVAAVLGCWAAACPLSVIGPAYAAPRTASPAAIANPTGVRFGESIRLLGYELPPSTTPGRPLEVALFWEGIHPIDESYVVAVRILDPLGQPATGLDSLPHGGRYSTVVWEPGRPFRDAYTLPPVSDSAAPGLGMLIVTLYPRGEPGAPLAVSVGDTPVGNEARLGAIKLAPQAPVTTEPSRAVEATFDNRFRLLGYDAPNTARPGETLPLRLYWEADGPDGKDYTVFVHMLNEVGVLIAQSDGPPQGGAYPTSIWSTGERVIDERAIVVPADAPPGAYTLLVGLYDPATGSRLPAHGTDGRRYADDAVPATSIRIVFQD
jgi:4-amino-4-deoxy-L-arabinose transferase-like glycosyltransferase